MWPVQAVTGNCQLHWYSMNTKNQPNPSKHSTFRILPKKGTSSKMHCCHHPISPPNGCEKGGINNYQYTVDLKYLISKLVTNVKCTQLQGVLRLMMYFIYRTHHPQMVRAVMNWHSYDDWLKNHHDDWLQNMIVYMSTIDKLMIDYKIMIDYM